MLAQGQLRLCADVSEEDQPRCSKTPSLFPASTRFKMPTDVPMCTCLTSSMRPKMPSRTTQLATEGVLFVLTQRQNASSAAALPAQYLARTLSSGSAGGSL